MILELLIHNLTKENIPELNKDKCINTYCKSSRCQICKESCFENAIIFKNGQIYFDEKLCTECGMCKVKCPTQAITLKGIGDEEIYVNAEEKENLVFSCSLEGAIGNLKISCLNSLHPELISALFIIHKEKKFHFNLSSCVKCQYGYDNSLFKDNLDKALIFVKQIGINPIFEIHTEESENSKLQDLITEVISRRNLFKMAKKESGNVVIKTLNTIIESNKNELFNRSVLLESLKNVKVEGESCSSDMFWEYWNVNINCDGCSKCIDVCPGKAWKIEKSERNIKVYYNFGNCFKCGLCEEICPKKALSKESISYFQLPKFILKKEINLQTCSTCNKKFIPKSKKDSQCDICKKKELLRKKISQFM